jgi:DNA-binding GntR family transcriptional regulator
MQSAHIDRVSVADQVATVLRQRILDGELRPGTSLQEVPLASSLGVSRNTMREAMRILSLEGLLKRNLHRGVAVSQLSVRDVQEIYELRRMLEIPAVLAAKDVASNHADTFLSELRSTLQQYQAAVSASDWVRAVSFDLQFHTILISIHRNKRLESFYQKVIGELRVGMVLVDRSHDNPGGLIPVHGRIYQLLSSGKLRQCAGVLARHLDDSELRLTRVMNGEIPKRNGKLVA